MDKIYLVALYPDQNELEASENTKKHPIEISLQLQTEKSIKNKGFRVEFAFTVDGMLGFGTELIRQAIDIKQHGLSQDRILGITASGSSIYMGAYLTSNSAELVIRINDNLNVEKVKTNYSGNNMIAENVVHISNKKEKHSNDYVQEYYLIDLYPAINELEDFEVTGKNLIEVKAQIPGCPSMQGRPILDRVYLTFSTDEMLEFGSELIRKVTILKRYNRGFKYAKPIPKILTPNDMGMHLTLDSAELLVTIKNLDKVDSVVNKLKKNWLIDKEFTYVSDIITDKIIIVSNSRVKNKFLKQLGANRKIFSKNTWSIRYISRMDLANKLQQLRDQDFMFSVGRGWPPIDIFLHFRDKNYVEGTVLCISWGYKIKIHKV